MFKKRLPYWYYKTFNQEHIDPVWLELFDLFIYFLLFALPYFFFCDTVSHKIKKKTLTNPKSKNTPYLHANLNLCARFSGSEGKALCALLGRVTWNDEWLKIINATFYATAPHLPHGVLPQTLNYISKTSEYEAYCILFRLYRNDCFADVEIDWFIYLFISSLAGISETWAPEIISK